MTDQNSRLEIVKRSHRHIWCDLAVKECDVCWAIRMLEEAQKEVVYLTECREGLAGQILDESDEIEKLQKELVECKEKR